MMLTNSERRLALAKARQRAMAFAEEADKVYNRIGEDGPEVNLATMWANVANALKVGPAAADGVTDGVGDPDPFGRPATINR